MQPKEKKLTYEHWQRSKSPSIILDALASPIGTKNTEYWIAEKNYLYVKCIEIVVAIPFRKVKEG